MVTLLVFDTAICGKIGRGTVSAGTDQTSNKPGKIDRTESALNPMHGEPSARCSNSGATGTARPGCPLFAASSRYCAQVRVGGRAEHVRWPVRERCGSGREGSLSGEGTAGWAHPALTGPSACAVIHSCRDAFGKPSSGSNPGRFDSGRPSHQCILASLSRTVGSAHAFVKAKPSALARFCMNFTCGVRIVRDVRIGSVCVLSTRPRVAACRRV